MKKAMLLINAFAAMIPGIGRAVISESGQQAGVVDPIIVAHRGACKDAPENTIPAFNLAWQQQADAIEGDFHLTKDGYIVCIHDENTREVAGTNLVIEESTLAQLRQLDVGMRYSKDYKGTVIPTISEVLSTVPKTKKIYIEIKCGEEIIPRLLGEIRSSRLEPEQTVIISSNSEVIRKLKAISPQYKAMLIVEFKRNLLGFVVPSRKAVMEKLSQSKADGLSLGKSHISKSFVKQVQEKGYEFHVWTVDDPADAKRFKELGAKSITTNNVARIKKYLAGKTEQTPAAAFY